MGKSKQSSFDSAAVRNESNYCDLTWANFLCCPHKVDTEDEPGLLVCNRRGRSLTRSKEPVPSLMDKKSSTKLGSIFKHRSKSKDKDKDQKKNSILPSLTARSKSTEPKKSVRDRCRARAQAKKERKKSKN